MSLFKALMAVAVIAVVSCESTRYLGAPLTPAAVEASAERLDGEQITVRGWIRMSDTLIGIQESSDPESSCIGLFVSESQYQSVESRNETWGEVTGVLAADGCDPAVRFCHDVCGPAVLIEPRFVE